jgi:DNA-binding NarL/FixJ family response regulator
MQQLRRRVVIVEPNDELRESYRLIINGSFKFSITGAYSNFEEAMRDLGKQMPDIFIMEIDLPGVSGIDATRMLREKYPHVKTILAANYEEGAIILEALKSGALGYLLKRSGYAELIAALEGIDNHGAYLSNSIARIIISNFHVNLNSPVTHRERQILQMLSVGKTYSEIAEELFISRETSKTHIRNIYQKLKVNSKSAAIAKANVEKLI